MSEYKILFTFRTGEIHLTDDVQHDVQRRSGVPVLFLDGSSYTESKSQGDFYQCRYLSGLHGGGPPFFSV